MAFLARFSQCFGYKPEHQLDTLLKNKAMNEATKTTKDITKKVKVESFDISRSDETLDLA